MPLQLTDHTQEDRKVFSCPISRQSKEWILNESARTGLSQKEILNRAIAALRKGPPLPTALPIKL
jgi:hypothetical protein